jgi:hypothetical protein
MGTPLQMTHFHTIFIGFIYSMRKYRRNFTFQKAGACASEIKMSSTGMRSMKLNPI